MARKALLASFAMALSMTTGALAQQAGTYSGTSADNNTISMTVTESGGVFTVTSASVGFVADCNVPGNTVTEGWGFFLGQQLTTERQILPPAMTTTTSLEACTLPATIRSKARSRV